MKKMINVLLTTGLLAVATQAVAVDNAAGKALAQKSGCLLCHGVDKSPMPGTPAYKDIAAKYKGQKDVEAKLVEKVKNGGSGVWGPMPMPANSPKVSDPDIKTLVQWVLSQ